MSNGLAHTETNSICAWHWFAREAAGKPRDLSMSRYGERPEGTKQLYCLHAGRKAYIVLIKQLVHAQVLLVERPPVEAGPVGTTNTSTQ